VLKNRAKSTPTTSKHQPPFFPSTFGRALFQQQKTASA